MAVHSGMAPMCSECENEIPPYSGKRRYTCSPECSYRRTRRHPGRDNAQKPCSECGGECPRRLSKGRPFVTCSEECTRLRRNRLSNEGRARAREASGALRPCLACGADLTGQAPARRRCVACGRAHRREMARQRQAARLAERLADAAARKAESGRRNRNRLMYAYGLTVDDYEAMVQAQQGRCAICGQSPAGRGKGDVLVIDHCHKKGQVRELLCGNCNIAIGLMDDAPHILVSAAKYLRRHRVG